MSSRARMSIKAGNRKKQSLPGIVEEPIRIPLLYNLGEPVSKASTFSSASTSQVDGGVDVLLRSNIEKAAVLIDQAMHGRWMPLDVFYHQDYATAKRAFLVYHHLSYPRCVALVTLIGLSLFEVPEWCSGPVENPCGDPEKYLLSGIWYLEPRTTVAIEFVCLLLLVFSVSLQRYFKFLSFWSEITVAKVTLLCALAVSILVSLVEVDWMRVLQGKKVTMYLRVLITIFFSRALRSCFRIAAHIGKAFIEIGVMVLVYVLMSAWVATLIFNKQFEDYPSALLKLFSLLTAANDADVWSETYPHRVALMFLFIYLIVGLFFLMNVAFAVIYTNLKAQMALEKQKRVTATKGALRAAFKLLDMHNRECIDGPTMISLFPAIGTYRHLPSVQSRNKQLFLALIKSQKQREDCKIWGDDFEDLCIDIFKEVQSQRRPRAADFSSYRPFEIMWLLGCLQFVKRKPYNLFIWFTTAMSLAVAISLRNVPEGDPRFVLMKVAYLFGIVFLLDTVFKILVLGRLYWRSALNCFDFILAIAIVSCHFASIEYPGAEKWIVKLLIVRSFRAVVLLNYFDQWRMQSELLIRMVSATAPILGMQFCVCSIFALLGTHLFEGVVHEGNPNLDSTAYKMTGLWVLNFNDFASAIATSLNLCIVGNWYVIMEGYAAATGSAWSRAYFISFWFITVAFALNVVISSFVESYGTEMEKVKVRARERERANLEQRTREAIRAHYNGLKRTNSAGSGHFKIVKQQSISGAPKSSSSMSN